MTARGLGQWLVVSSWWLRRAEGSRERAPRAVGAARLGFYVAAEPEEENRRTSLHAQESPKRKLADHPMDWPSIGHGLAVEQFLLLRETQEWLDSRRSCEMNGRNTENSKARPFENHEESATRKFNVKGFAARRKGGPPARPTQLLGSETPLPETLSQRVGHPRESQNLTRRW